MFHVRTAPHNAAQPFRHGSRKITTKITLPRTKTLVAAKWRERKKTTNRKKENGKETQCDCVSGKSRTTHAITTHACVARCACLPSCEQHNLVARIRETNESVWSSANGDRLLLLLLLLFINIIFVLCRKDAAV